MRRHPPPARQCAAQQLLEPSWPRAGPKAFKVYLGIEGSGLGFRDADILQRDVKTGRLAHRATLTRNCSRSSSVFVLPTTWQHSWEIGPKPGFRQLASRLWVSAERPSEAGGDHMRDSQIPIVSIVVPFFGLTKYIIRIL